MSVTLTITEGPVGLVIRIEGDPPLPMTDGELDLEELTAEQAAAVYAAQVIGDAGDGPLEWRILRTG